MAMERLVKLPSPEPALGNQTFIHNNVLGPIIISILLSSLVVQYTDVRNADTLVISNSAMVVLTIAMSLGGANQSVIGWGKSLAVG